MSCIRTLLLYTLHSLAYKGTTAFHCDSIYIYGTTDAGPSDARPMMTASWLDGGAAAELKKTKMSWGRRWGMDK